MYDFFLHFVTKIIVFCPNFTYNLNKCGISRMTRRKKIMRLSKEIVSHIFSAWCAESGEPALWNWIKNDGKEPSMERLNADLLVSDIEYPNLDDFKMTINSQGSVAGCG